MAEAERLAAQLGTSVNDVIVRLAEEGAGARERRRRAEDLARQRRQAVARGDGADGFPPPSVVREAMLGGRRTF